MWHFSWQEWMEWSQRAPTAGRVQGILRLDKTKPFFSTGTVRGLRPVSRPCTGCSWTLLKGQATVLVFFFLLARENIVWITRKPLNTSICCTSHLHPLPLRRHKDNIIRRLLKMCMTDIAEKSTRLHQCCSHSCCQRDGSPSPAAESHKLINIDTDFKIKVKPGGSVGSNNACNAHVQMGTLQPHFMQSAFWDNETMIQLLMDNLVRPVNVAFVPCQCPVCSRPSELSLFRNVFHGGEHE